MLIILMKQHKLYLLNSYSRNDYLRSLLLGFLNPFLYYLILFKAYSLLPAQEAQPLNFVWPIMLVLLSIPLLGQKITVRKLTAICVSFVGVLVISTRGNILEFKVTSPLGVLLALGSSIIWSLFWIYNVRDERDECVKLFLNFISGFVFAAMALVLFSRLRIPAIAGLIGAVYVGLFEMGITFLIWLKALKLSETTAQVTNLIYLVPFFSLILINFAVGEKILLSTLIGLVLIISGIILQQYSGSSNTVAQCK